MTPITWTVTSIKSVPGTVIYYYNLDDRFSDSDVFIRPEGGGTFTWTPRSWDIGPHFLHIIAREYFDEPGWVQAEAIVEFRVAGVSADEQPILSSSSDFAGNRQPNLIWNNTVTGELAVWFKAIGSAAMWSEQVQGDFLHAPALPAGWRVAGAGDVDGDGHTDLVLQSNTGLLGVWFFDGLTLRYGTSLNPGLVDPQWQIRAIGDMNHDGHPDLVWQYAPTGQVAIWLMDGVNGIGYVMPAVAPPGADWEIVGTGDSNRDGDRDLFWQHRTQGTLAVWQMGGTEVQAGGVLPESPADPRWRVVAVVDLNGDAYSDVVFKHDSTNLLAGWYLQGMTVNGGISLFPTLEGYPYWKIVGPR